MMPDGDTAAHLRKQVGGLFFESVLTNETFAGERRKADEPDNKTVILGMVERGKIAAGPNPDVTTYTVEGINKNVVAGSD